MSSILLSLGIVIFLKAVSAEGEIDGNCGRGAANACTGEFSKQLVEKGDASEVDCQVLRNTQQCLLDLADKCFDEIEKIKYKTNVKRMISKVNAACEFQRIRNKEEEVTLEEKETERCHQNTKKLQSYLKECTKSTFQRLSHVRKASDIAIGDKKCTLFWTIALCVTAKVGELCGPSAERPFLQGMMTGLKDPEAIKSPACATARRKLNLDRSDQFHG